MKIIKEATELKTTEELANELGLDQKGTFDGFTVFYKVEDISDREKEEVRSSDSNNPMFFISQPLVEITALVSKKCYEDHDRYIFMNVARSTNSKINRTLPMKYIKSFKVKPKEGSKEKYITKYLITKRFDLMVKDEEKTSQALRAKKAEEDKLYNKVHEIKLDNGKVVKYRLDGKGSEHNINSMYGHSSQDYIVINSDELTKEDVQKAFDTFKNSPLVDVFVKDSNPFKVSVTWYND